MKATIEEIKAAKRNTETQITKILADFAKQYELSDVDVDVRVMKHFEERPGAFSGAIALTISTEISVKL